MRILARRAEFVDRAAGAKIEQVNVAGVGGDALKFHKFAKLENAIHMPVGSIWLGGGLRASHGHGWPVDVTGNNQIAAMRRLAVPMMSLKRNPASVAFDLAQFRQKRFNCCHVAHGYHLGVHLLCCQILHVLRQMRPPMNGCDGGMLLPLGVAGNYAPGFTNPAGGERLSPARQEHSQAGMCFGIFTGLADAFGLRNIPSRWMFCIF